MTRSNEADETNQASRSIGRYGRRTVILSVRAEPSLDASAPEEFAVNLSIAQSDGTNVDVARIDTSHDGVHFDRLYLPVNDPLRRDYSVDVVDYREAQRILLENWRSHVAEYERNHGLPCGRIGDRG